MIDEINDKCYNLPCLHTVYTHPTKNLNNHLPSHSPTYTIKRKLRQPKARSHQPALPILLVRSGVTSRVHCPEQNPCGTEHTRCKGELQTSDEEGGEERNIVFEEVVMSALGAVEEVHVLFLGGVGCGRE